MLSSSQEDFLSDTKDFKEEISINKKIENIERFLFEILLFL